jgi:hypothetical protein
MGGLPCKEKILLNGGTIASEAGMLLSRVAAPGTVELTEEDGYEIIKHLNTAEDAMFRAKRAWLKSQNYDGPLPHALTFRKIDNDEP